MERRDIDTVVDKVEIVQGTKNGRTWQALMLTFINGNESMIFPSDGSLLAMAELLLEKQGSGSKTTAPRPASPPAS